MIRHLTLYIALTLSLIGSAAGQDCVPLAFTTLSQLYSRPVSYASWMHDLMPHGGTSTNLAVALDDWERREPLLTLRCVYPTLLFTQLFTEGRPYLCILLMPANAVVTQEHDDSNGHACLVYFHDDFVVFYSTIVDGPNLAVYLMEKVTWDEFYKRAVAVYDVEPAAPLLSSWKMIVGVRDHQEFLLTPTSTGRH